MGMRVIRKGGCGIARQGRSQESKKKSRKRKDKFKDRLEKAEDVPPLRGFIARWQRPGLPLRFTCEGTITRLWSGRLVVWDCCTAWGVGLCPGRWLGSGRLWALDGETSNLGSESGGWW